MVSLYVWNKIISAAETVLELFQNYLSDIDMLENIRELQLYSEIILK